MVGLREASIWRAVLRYPDYAIVSDIIFDHADVAQLVEQLIRNEKVDSSIPFIGTKNSYANCCVRVFFTLNILEQTLRTQAL